MNRWDRLAVDLGCQPVAKMGWNRVNTDVPPVDAASRRSKPKNSSAYRFKRPNQRPWPVGPGAKNPSAMPRGVAIGDAPISIGKHKLSAAERNALPASAFADPKNRRFPMNDASHARLAVAMADRGGAGAKVKGRIKRKAGAKGIGAPSLAKGAFGYEPAIPPGVSQVRRKPRKRKPVAHVPSVVDVNKGAKCTGCGRGLTCPKCG